MFNSIVSWYSGYKRNEYPLVFIYHGDKKMVKRLLEEKHIEDSKSKIRKREFLVKTENDEVFLIAVGKNTEIERK
ncbi:hypothetical protein KAU34_04845 [candidate division WOR-3 bacterium]|nr:hypothetical protein [candidate division WOR-3 bacterium]MCK4575711.1 hypothetical protein [candidate division WOR-3 bacterium]